MGGVGFSLLVTPLTGEAQQSGKVWRIGVLWPTGSKTTGWAAFVQGLQELRYVEGQNLVIEDRLFEDRVRGERLPAAAAELVRLDPDVIFAPGSEEVLRAAHQSTTTIPIKIPGTNAPALFIFDTLDGLIVGWSPDVNETQGIVVANRFAAGASYTGLAIAGPARDPHIYAANSAGDIDVFDKEFNFLNSFAADSSPPANFAPYGIQTIGKKLYVTYFNPTGLGELGGILDVCKLSHKHLTKPKCRRLFASFSSLSQSSELILADPWGIARAPSHFGAFSHKLLVGNVDDGRIHAFEPRSGHLIGTLGLTDGRPFEFPGLWGLAFGRGTAQNGATNQLFFTAGPFPPNHPELLYSEGVFGVITPAGREEDSSEAD